MTNSLSLFRTDTGAKVIEVLHTATNIWSRFVGLQFRRALPPNEALLIVPCSSIHTMCVRFALDVFFLSEHGEVTEVRRNVRPWKVALPNQSSHAVLETTAGAIDLDAGTKLYIKPTSDKLPSPLRFLAGAKQSEAQPC